MEKNCMESGGAIPVLQLFILECAANGSPHMLKQRGCECKKNMTVQTVMFLIRIGLVVVAEERWGRLAEVLETNNRILQILHLNWLARTKRDHWRAKGW